MLVTNGTISRTAVPLYHWTLALTADGSRQLAAWQLVTASQASAFASGNATWSPRLVRFMMLDSHTRASNVTVTAMLSTKVTVGKHSMVYLVVRAFSAEGLMSTAAVPAIPDNKVAYFSVYTSGQSYSGTNYAYHSSFHYSLTNELEVAFLFVLHNRTFPL